MEPECAFRWKNHHCPEKGGRRPGGEVENKGERCRLQSETETAYPYTSSSCHSIAVPNAGYPFGLFVEEDYVCYVTHLGAFIADVFLYLEDCGGIVLCEKVSGQIWQYDISGW